MGGEGAAECVSILSLLDPLPWSEMPFLRYGGGGRRTEMVCGYMHSTDPLFDPALRALPSVFVVRLPSGPAARWVQASIDYALADSPPLSNLSSNPLATRLPELVLTEVLRAHLATAPAIDHGWIAALRDPDPGAGSGGDAQRSRPPLDRRHARRPRRSLPLVARRPVPADPGPVTHPVPHGVAHAPRHRPPGDDGAVGLHHRPAGRLRGPRRRSAGRSSASGDASPSHWRRAAEGRRRRAGSARRWHRHRPGGVDARRGRAVRVPAAAGGGSTCRPRRRSARRARGRCRPATAGR